jgi:DNA modification methylase
LVLSSDRNFHRRHVMTTKELVNAHKLKNQFQIKTAQRRSENKAATRLVAARAGPGRNDLQPQMATVMRPVGALCASRTRSRETTPEILEGVIRSFKRYGVILPVVIDRDDVIIQGHVMWEAAQQLGFETIECRVVDHLDAVEIEALGLALNRIGELGKFDLEKLRDQMIRIESHGIELISTGFTLPQIDQIMIISAQVQDDQKLLDDEEEDQANEGPVVSRLGDLFQLGRHCLFCGDATDAASYHRVLGDSKADAVFTDPPYNCKIENFVGGLGQHKHKDFVQFAGKESDEQFSQFLLQFLRHCKEFTSVGAVIFACIDWRQVDRMLIAGREAGLERINMAVWQKGAGGMGRLYRSAYELIPVFCNGKSPATNNVELGVHGRDRTNVFTYPGANRRGSSAAAALADHPTPKPVELVVDALMDVTKRDTLVLDPFIGSGTLFSACEQSGRRGAGIELDPKYVDSSIRRWELLTGEEAVHVDTGLTFAQLAESRSDASGEAEND